MAKDKNNISYVLLKVITAWFFKINSSKLEQ